MPNAKTFPTPSSNNQNNAIPSERLSELSIIDNRIHMIITDSRMIDEECVSQECVSRRLREYYENRFREDPNCQDLNQIAELIRFSEILANLHRQDLILNDELLRFSEDDIDSNIDSDIDSDDGFPNPIDENGMPFDD